LPATAWRSIVSWLAASMPETSAATNVIPSFSQLLDLVADQRDQR
jgi:hypothetical protein